MIIEKYSKSATNVFGFVVIKPDDYSASVLYPLHVFVHGNGDRGTGIDNYANAIPSELKAAVDKFKFIVIAVQYDTPDTNAHIDHALNYASANLMIDLKRIGLSAFSLGGGEVTRYVTTSLQNADKFAYVVSVGGLNKLISTGIKHIIDSKLPMLFFHSKNDPAASVSNTNNAVAQINAANPAIPAKAILYEGNLHDVTNKVFSTTQYPWVGNEIPATVWEYLLTLTKDNPITVPTTGGAIKPIAVAEDFTTATDKIKLIGNRSRNCRPDRSKWDVVSVPEGLNKYAVEACGYIDCDNITLPREGKYVFRLMVADISGQTDSKDITVTYSKGGTIPDPEPVKRKLIAVNRVGWRLLFDDESEANAISVVDDVINKTVTYKVSDTESYTINI